MLITNEMMKEYGVTQEQIHEDAMKSSPRVMVPEVSSIGVLIDEIYQKNILMLTPDEREMLLETLQESSEMPTFFVVTNTERVNGAGVIFYPEFMDNMGELLGNNFFILPSSIHQMLILPDDGQVDAEMLRDMVKEVNATQVAPAERLTNDVYHFDTKKTGRFLHMKEMSLLSITIFFRSLVIRNSQRSIPDSSKDIIRVF